MRRHRIHEAELPAVKVGLHSYLSEMCSEPTDIEANIIAAFRLFYRVINYKAGQPDYPTILDEDGNIQYSVIANHLKVAQENDPDLQRMVPFLRENIIRSEIHGFLPVLPRTGNHLTSSFIGAQRGNINAKRT